MTQIEFDAFVTVIGLPEPIKNNTYGNPEDYELYATPLAFPEIHGEARSTDLFYKGRLIYHALLEKDLYDKYEAEVKRVTDRERYKKRGIPRIIAVDFDGCLATVGDGWPGVGDPIRETFKALQQELEAGAKWILWTVREGEVLDNAIAFCHEHGLYPDAVNSNIPEFIERFGDSRKIFADEYWDDHSVRMGQMIRQDDIDNLLTPDTDEG